MLENIGNDASLQMLNKSSAEQNETCSQQSDRLSNLGVDLLLDVFDYLSIETLCIVADTCKYLQTIAQKSFIQRKIKKISYDFKYGTLRKGEFYINSPQLFFRIFRHFGNSIETVNIDFEKIENVHILNAISDYGSDILQTMYLFNWHSSIRDAIHANRLFAAVELVQFMHMRIDHPAYIDCHKILFPKRLNDPEKLLPCPMLKTINMHISSNFNETISLFGHIESSTVTFCWHSDCENPLKFPNVVEQLNASHMRIGTPKSKILYIKNPGEKFFPKWAINNLVLEELLVNLELDYPLYWAAYATIPCLRVLSIYLVRVQWHCIIAKAIAVLIKRKQDTIKHIEIDCPMEDFPYELYQPLNEVCQSYGVLVTIHGPLKGYKMRSVNRREMCTSEHIFAYYGKH